jgi:DNA replication protein DnaC
VLLIDEIGLQRHTESTLFLLSEVLCERYDALKPTLLISNWPAQGSDKHPGLREMLGTRLFDRLTAGQSKVLIFDWPSYRHTQLAMQPHAQLKPSLEHTSSKPKLPSKSKPESPNSGEK